MRRARREACRRGRLGPRVGGCAALCLGLQLLTTTARAGDADDVHTAETLADEAYAQHVAGKYAEAIGTYLKAYELSKAGAILFNIAAIYDRKLGERRLAIEYYRRYAQAPDATPEFVQKATVRLSVLRQAQEEEARAKTPAVTSAESPPAPAAPPPVERTIAEPPPAADVSTPAAQPDPWRTWRTAGLIAGGAGIAALGTSLVLGLVAKSKNDDADALCDASTCTTQRGVSLDHQAAGFATAATISFVAGAALLAGGVTLYFVAPRTSASSARVSLAPLVSANGAALVLRGSL